MINGCGLNTSLYILNMVQNCWSPKKYHRVNVTGKKMKMDTARTLPTTHHHSNHNHLHHNSNREGKKYVLNSLHCQQFFKVYKFETVNRSVHRDFKRNWRPSSGKPKYIPAYFPTGSNRKKILFKFYAMTRNIDDGPFCLMIPNHIETNKTTKCQCLRRAA